jgi:hypothetical protein
MMPFEHLTFHVDERRKALLAERLHDNVVALARAEAGPLMPRWFGWPSGLSQPQRRGKRSDAQAPGAPFRQAES